MLPTQHDRSVVREVPQAGGVRPERREAERRLRDLRARRLLRLPQDPRLREPAEAGPDSHADRLEADGGLGEDLDSQSEGGQADHLDAARLVQLEFQHARGRGPQRGRDQRDRGLSLRQRHGVHEPDGVEPAARRRQARRADRQDDRLPRAATSSTRRRAPRPVRTAPSASRSRTSATRRPTSGSTTGCAIRSTTAPTPTCPTCA